MKLKLIIFLLALSLLTPLLSVKAAPVSNMGGKILLQVESKGEAWYVNPKDGKRYYMADGDQAFQIMKNLGIGMSNADIQRMKTDAVYRKKFIGKILLQVESKGEAYYISSDGRYNYLKDGASAYQVMRKLGLGISNANLSKIEEYKIKSKETSGTAVSTRITTSTKAIVTAPAKILDMPQQIISTTTPISSLKKLYKNDTFKFQFEVPKSLSIEETAATTLGTTYFKVKTQELGKKYSTNYAFEVFVTRDDPKNPFSKKYSTCQGNVEAACEKIKFHGQDTLKSYYYWAPEGSAQYQFLYNGYLLNMGVYISSDDKARIEDYSKVALEIFNSFTLFK